MSESGKVSDSIEVRALMTRYWDAYIVARVIAGYGNLVKIAGAVLAGLILLVALLIAGRGGGGFLFVVGLLIATVVGVLFYIVGLIVAAQGEMLKAMLDGAVNSSPFLTNNHRAKIMSLGTSGERQSEWVSSGDEHSDNFRRAAHQMATDKTQNLHE